MPIARTLSGAMPVRRPRPPGGSAADNARLALAERRLAATRRAPRGGLSGSTAGFMATTGVGIPDEEKPRGLLKQLIDLPRNLPHGVASFLKAGVTDVLAPVRIANDLITSGHLHRPAGVEEGDYQLDENGVPRGFAQSDWSFVSNYLPASSGMLESGERTIGRVTNPVRGFREYQQASREGRIVDVAVEDVANLSIIAGATGKALGAGGGVAVEGTTAAERGALLGAEARAGGAAVAEDLATGAPRHVFQVTPEGVAARMRQTVPFGEAAREVPQTIMTPRTGLAGVLERRGVEGAAATSQRIGEVLQTGSHMGDKALTGATAWPYQMARGAGRALYDVLDEAVQKTGRPALPPLTVSGMAERFAPQALWRFTDEGRLTRRLENQSQTVVRDQMREAMATGRMGRQFGVSKAEGAAVLNSLDYPDMLTEVQGMTPEQLGEMLDKAYEGVESGTRPTPEIVQATWDYANRNLPPERLAAMDAVRARLLQQLDIGAEQAQKMTPARFNRQLGKWEYQPGLNPEQLGADYLTPEMNQIRRQHEMPRDIAQQAWEANEPGAVRLERIANAREALAAELPEPLPDRAADFKRGRATGKQSIRDQQARAEHRVTLERLQNAVDHYASLADDAPVEQIKEVADRIDQLTTRAQEIKEYIEGARRRPGTRVPRGELGELRARAKEIGAEEAEKVRGEIDQMTGGARLSVPARGQVGGEWDWWRDGRIDNATKTRLRKDGWLTPARQGETPENFADFMSSAYNREMSVDEAVAHYIDTIKRYWDEQSGKGDSAVGRVALERNIHPDQVIAALRGNLREYVTKATGDAESAMNQLRDEYAALDDDQRGTFNDIAEAMLADPEATATDFAELFDSFLPGADAEALARDLGNRVPARDVLAWVRGGEKTAAMEAAARQVKRGAVAEVSARPTVGPSLGEVMPPTTKGNPWKRYTGTTSTGETTNPLSRAEREQQAAAVARDRADSVRAAQVRRRRAINYRNEKIADLRTELGRSFQDRIAEDVNGRAIGRVRGRIDRAAPTLGGIVGSAESAELSGLTRDLATKYGAYEDITTVLDRLQDDMLKAARADAEEAGVSVATVRLPSDVVGDVVNRVFEAKGVILEVPDRVALDDAIGKGILLEDIDAVVDMDRTTARRLNTPYRVAELVHDTEWNMPDDVRTSIDRDMEQYQRSRTKAWKTTYNDHTKALPAPRRTYAMRQQRAIGALMDMAEERNRVDPGSGDVFLEMAEAMGNTLSDMAAKGIDPEYLIGGGEPSASSSAGGRFIGGRKRRGQQQRQTGLRAQTLDAFSRVMADDAKKWALNVRDNTFMESGLARRVDALPTVKQRAQGWADTHGGEPLPWEDMKKAADDDGYSFVPGGKQGPDAIALPKQVVKYLDYELPQFKPIRALARANQAWKQWILPFSSKWIMGNVIGNTLMASFNAGVGPVELLRYLNRIRKDEGGMRNWWENEGLSRAVPNELANYGLTHTERQIWQNYADEGAATRPGRFVQKWAGRSYQLNEFVDNATRSATYLAQRAKGMTREAALESTLKALGDFTRMSPLERKYIRQAFPFYAWIRHSFMATLRLPIESPTRAAILYNISNIFADPEIKDEFLARIGGVPIAGGFLDIGNVSPWYNFQQQNPLESTNYTGGLSPFLKLPLEVGFGWDPGRMKDITPAGRPSPLAHLLTDPRHGLGEIGYIAAQNAPAPIRSLRDVALGPQRRSDLGYATRSTKPDYNRIALIMRGLNLPSYTRPSGG